MTRMFEMTKSDWRMTKEARNPMSLAVESAARLGVALRVDLAASG